MANEVTGDGIMQLAQVANMARSFLAGPEDFAVRVLTREAADLAGMGSMLAPISSLSTIGKTLGIKALAPLGPIGLVAGLVSGLFRKKPKGPAIAHLPPHHVIATIHQKEAIHLFLKSAGAMEGEVQAMERRQMGIRCQAQSAPAGFHDFAPHAVMFAPATIITSAALNLASSAWAPAGTLPFAVDSDANVAKVIRSVGGASVRGLFLGGRRGEWGYSQPSPTTQASACVRSTWGPWGRGFTRMVGGSGGQAVFDTPKFIEAMMANPACSQEKLVSFGSPYLCAWAATWAAYHPSLLRVYRAEIGDWMHEVARHPLYKDLIRRMVAIELERKRIRTSNARGIVAVIRNPTVANIRGFAFQPIGPGLIPLAQVVPTTVEALGIRQALLTARTDAQAAVNTAQAAVVAAREIKARPELLEKVEGFLAQAVAAAGRAFDTTDAAVATQAAKEAQAAGAQAQTTATPVATRALEFLKGPAFEFLKDPKVFIPALLVAGGLLLASSEEGA